jgi:hypothetical protein
VNPPVDEIRALISGEEIENGADLPDAPTAKETPNSSRQAIISVMVRLTLVCFGDQYTRVAN